MILTVVPFLPVQSDFHPKRNQARQKLATLSTNRFKDLASDVYHELERRYPQLKSSATPVVTPQTTISRPTSGTVKQKDLGSIEAKEAERKAATSQNNVAATEKDPFGVNFQTLDNLMADLGSMIATSLDEPKTEPNTRAKENDEERVLKPMPSVTAGHAVVAAAPTVVSSTLAGHSSSAFEELKGENERLKSDKQSLQLEVDRVSAELSRVKIESQKVLRELEHVSEEKERTSREYAEQVNHLRVELKNLQRELSSVNPEKYLQEIEALTHNMKEIEGERDGLKQVLRNLETENKSLQDQVLREQCAHGSAKAELEELRRLLESKDQELIQKSRGLVEQPKSPVQPLDKIRLDDLSLYSEHGFVHRIHLDEFKASVVELLRASKNDTPAAVLIAMKSIVVSTRNISDGLERYEAAKGPQNVSGLRTDVSTHLTNLMNAAKNHATGLAGPEQIEVCANELATDIVNIMNIARISKALGIEKLKTFLEQQTDLIVQNIQVLLQAMRQATFGQEFRQTITNITTVVDNLIQVSRTSLETSDLKEKSDIIIISLAKSNHSLGELGDGMLGEKKPSKQKLAAAAYEVAKFTKELVSLFDLDH